MKKFMMFLLAAVLLQSCGNKTGHAVGDSEALAADTLAAEPLTNESLSEVNVDKHSEAYIRQRIDAMYETVGRPTYDSDGNRVEYIENPFNRDSAYCSQRYYTLMQQALQVCEEAGDILYDYDHWVCGQDFSDDWSCEVKSVYEVTDSTALVDLLIHNFGDHETTIALRFERNDWYIDDFSPSKDGNDDQQYLRDIIRTSERSNMGQ